MEAMETEPNIQTEVMLKSRKLSNTQYKGVTVILLSTGVRKFQARYNQMSQQFDDERKAAIWIDKKRILNGQQPLILKPTK